MHAQENRLTLGSKTQIFFFSLPPRLPKLKPSQEHSNPRIFLRFSLPKTHGKPRENGAQTHGFFTGFEHPKSDELKGKNPPNFHLEFELESHGFLSKETSKILAEKGRGMSRMGVTFGLPRQFINVPKEYGRFLQGSP